MTPAIRRHQGPCTSRGSQADTHDRLDTCHRPATTRRLPHLGPAPPSGVRPLRFVVCDDCGRITARRWTGPTGRVYAWCAGEFPDYPTTVETTR